MTDIPSRKPQALLLALGNPLMGDDGVAPLAARALRRRYREDIDIDESPVAGFALLDLLSGYNRALIIDASATGNAPPLACLSPGKYAYSAWRSSPRRHSARGSVLPLQDRSRNSSGGQEKYSTPG
jgi:hypothetical protein